MNYYHRTQKETRLYKIIDLLVRIIPPKYVVSLFHFIGLKECEPPETIGIVCSIRYETGFRLKYAIKKYIWKTQKAGFYARFQSSKISNFLTNYFERAKKSFISISNVLRNKFKIKTKGQLAAASTKELCFPSEIWLEIVHYNINPANLIRVNTKLFNLISPMVYNSFHLDLVLSSTYLLQRQYSHYLEYADRYYIHPKDPYKLFENFQKSKTAQYEFLDTSHRKFPGESSYTSSCELSSGAVVSIKTKIFRDFEDVKRFFNLTINNEKSYFKQFVQELSTNITIIDDFNDLFEDCLGKTINKLSKNDALNVLTCEPESFHVFDFFNTEYEDCIRENVKPPLGCEVDFELACNLFLTSKDILPQQPYFREITIAGVLFDNLQDHKKRRSLHYITTQSDLKDSNPFRDWALVRKPKYNFFSKKETASKGPGTVKVHKHHFVTEEETFNFLSQFVNSCSKFESHRDINCSTLISGVTKVFGTSPDLAQDDSQIPYDFQPQIILINRSH
ncbi:hypothetical protein BN7_2778 [Wickerhamomyces ciferrii]|uniref:Uncharacterized protein n=1 Tax=Wickerhamomyces ciferrii (strain ATCC 14091 / BCRC 22168 / CBS 111 / JCM 3599 / NBRC 0793 / NRRL Y-1031 F-60-10) TaxID=1206466 RepID=K0KJW8_WICCF|nr:uncharacterized protein BN7_2778 [Wickerhamomyces ciferrii]CCH43231.1 hypothetical protein BN7_2778 [Wickerhamomyces ciferrii]